MHKSGVGKLFSSFENIASWISLCFMSVLIQDCNVDSIALYQNQIMHKKDGCPTRVLGLQILRKEADSYLRMSKSFIRYIDACEQGSLSKIGSCFLSFHGGCMDHENRMPFSEPFTTVVAIPRGHSWKRPFQIETSWIIKANTSMYYRVLSSLSGLICIDWFCSRTSLNSCRILCHRWCHIRKSDKTQNGQHDLLLFLYESSIKRKAHSIYTYSTLIRYVQEWSIYFWVVLQHER